MNRSFLMAVLIVLLAAGIAAAQMGRGMMMHEEEYEAPPAQGQGPGWGPGYGMMGPGYGMMGPGYGMMGPGYGMMGPGYGMMGPGYGMMGPGYGMGPGMMHGWGPGGGWGMGPGMMGPGYGMMGPGMMHGYGMGCGMEPGWWQFGPENRKFLDETRDLRRELHMKKFDYMEALRDPDTPPETLDKLRSEMHDLIGRLMEKR